MPEMFYWDHAMGDAGLICALLGLFIYFCKGVGGGARLFKECPLNFLERLDLLLCCWLLWVVAKEVRLRWCVGKPSAVERVPASRVGACGRTEWSCA